MGLRGFGLVCFVCCWFAELDFVDWLTVTAICAVGLCLVFRLYSLEKLYLWLWV